MTTNARSSSENTKRIVLATFGSLGDLHPYIALALELRSRGHVPVIAANGAHRVNVESEGIEFHTVRPDIADLGTKSAVMQKVMDIRHGPEYLIKELLMPRLRDSYTDIASVCTGADLLISHPITLAAPLVAEKMRPQRLAWASVVLSPSSFLSAYDPPILAPAPWLHRFRVFGPSFYGKVLNQVKNTIRSWAVPWHHFRRELGLPPTLANPIFDGQFSPQLVLALFSPLLAAPQLDWPPNTVGTGFPFYDRRDNNGDLDAALEAFLNAGDPPIVFTLGSAASLAAGDFYAQSLGAALKLGRRALLITGRDPANRPNALPEEVAAFEYVSFSKVFSRAAAVVHQGGIGTTGQALRAGRPAMIVPFGFDQPDNAARAVRLGVARTIARSHYTAASAANELGILLGDEQYSTTATAVGHKIQSENGVGAACDALELLLLGMH